MKSQTKNRPPGRRPPREAAGPPRLFIYGRHAAAAALANPARKIRALWATKNAADWLAGRALPAARLAALREARPDDIDRLLPEGAVHQGIALEVEDLPRARLKEVCDPADGRPVVVLDQIADPQNIGAIFRSAAAFGAAAIVVQDRRTPPLAGALAKAAAGALERVPCVRAVNIARALEALKERGYHCAGLAGEAETPVAAIPADAPAALVLGAEGAGLRRLVAETCDRLYRIPIAPAAESLNVSVAAAVCLYELTRRRSTA
ncbi:23S rRNA (guanosine(2251)-2'-O)-methyltransferase RlmB [Amphiplicatus metriothermophilus]|uniref:23S rRNA (Guanosine2251-2'-O)-methyltransferase n=1 Tax=Amphiplicatus metriothermophilus TaxID=1519374 RepID=A0A239PX98_9PROT|nr:23S rRNA (guanosine(2251)-2'-O)-methyltransferase RlmB [Amphiplicatus metriothermophilus]MBB5519897.1 23S rRNA (guanosine2251-2'-O)-methyltransferase [Amphiplicatus metriothermophilus]SNT74800.1 23S rRNA (guanosine2251-2'-O)-methyltransferase [Amphiplicatus metriothermophilus]